MPVPRFRIRTLMIAVAVVGLGLSMLIDYDGLSVQKQELVDLILTMLVIPLLPFGVFLLLSALSSK